MNLKDLLNNAVTIDIIEVLFEEKELSQTEIIKKTKLAKLTVIKKLRIIETNKLVLVRKIGVTKLYLLNSDYFLVKQIKILKTLANLAELDIADQEVYLYGSAARGEDKPESDIDILAIGKTTRQEMLDKTGKLSKKIGKNIKTQIFTQKEWMQMMKKDPAFYERVEKDKIRIK